MLPGAGTGGITGGPGGFHVVIEIKRQFASGAFDLCKDPELAVHGDLYLLD